MATFRGYPACACLIEWLPAYEAELKRRGILKTGSLRIYQLIGGAKASGGTHSTGGAFDILDLPGGDDIWVARQMGADATWSRPYNWDNRKGMAHVHGVLTGCPHNGPARYQITDVKKDLNGLANHGKDTGPRPLSGRTWEQGIAWAKAQAKPAPVPASGAASKPKPSTVPAPALAWSTEVYTINTLGAKPADFAKRMKIVAKEINLARPSILFAQECYSVLRPRLSSRLESRYALVGQHRGKVMWVDKAVWGYVSDSRVGYSLGHGKHAFAAELFRRDNTDERIAASVGHLISGEQYGQRRIEEMDRWAELMTKSFRRLPHLLGADFNDFRDARSGVRREALRHGLHDPFTDLRQDVVHGEHNSYNGLKHPAPKEYRYIDGFLVSEELYGVRGRIDVHAWPYGTDHFGVEAVIGRRA